MSTGQESMLIYFVPSIVICTRKVKQMIPFAFVLLFTMYESEFLTTAHNQLEDGYSWQSIECRESNGTVPSLEMNNKTVCYKLEK